MRCFRHVYWLMFFLLTAVFVTIGCSQETLSSPSTATSVTPTASPIGLSRENPLNGLEPILLKNWEVRVLDIVRGPNAWKRIHDANQFNEPAPEDWAYVLIQFQIKNRSSNMKEANLGMHLTGNAHILHYSFNNSEVPPEPILNTFLAGGETSQGWDVFLVKEDESDLMLVLDDLSAYEEPDYFARLDERASLTVPTSLSAIEATDFGRDLMEPLPYGQIATSENWQITLQEIERGQAAWNRIQSANRFNDPPPEGQMYLLVKVWVRYIGTHTLGAPLNRSDFELVNHDNQQIPQALVGGLGRRSSLLKLYPGGEYEEWLAFLVSTNDSSLVLQFSPGYADDDNRYLSLLQDGR